MGHPFCSREGLNKVLDSLCGGSEKSKSIDSNLNDDAVKMMIKGKIVLMKKNVLDITDQGAYFLDWVYELFGKGVTLQLISSVHGDPEQGLKGKRGKTTSLGKWSNIPTPVTASEVAFDVSLEWDESIGLPGAFIIKNNHRNEFYLKTLTLEDIPNHGKVHFVCNSWVYPAKRYKYDRVFFSNKTYLPGDMPKTLQPYREQELKNLQGNGSGSGMLKEWDRVYDYAYYNDLGSPEKGKDFGRPVLGGTKEYPYPRRGKTGRAPNKKDSKTESRLMLLSLDIYVPRDERFNQVKFSDFLGYAAKSLCQILVAGVTSVFDKTPTEFDKFSDVLELYNDDGLPPGVTPTKLQKCIPLELFQEITRSDGERLYNFPMPDVIKVNQSAWRTDEEFAREMLAGVNPVSISRLKEFPAKSKLNPEVYGNQTSTITREQVEKNMTGLGLNVDEAIECNRMFILDHHDALMPYLRRINTTNSKIYASRTILVLQNDGTLKPLAIELSLPHPQGDKHGVTSHVFTPAHEGIEGHIWQLAKAYAAVNDSGYHQLISHWLNTHAVIEPFVIATNRQLSVVHPIYKLLHPHFRDTMNINALARQILINAGGVLEMTVFPAKYSMEMSSAVYKDWILNEQSLPADLLKRGVAVEDPTKENGVRLLIEDYPFAVDGLEIWSAIETWVHEYCCIYYPTDESIQSDTELQTWWTELREEGHGDKKDETWWPKMQTRDELIKTCAIVIWVASALHAAVNFGQYSYAGYLPNRPTVSRRFMPEPGTAEYRELESDPELAFLKTITAQFQTLLGVSLIEILSRHASDEIYLGQRETKEWTTDIEALEAFDRFGSNLKAIEQNIERRNHDETLKNRVGPVMIPYTLLYPNTTADTKDPKNVGLSGKGIPNSVSI